MKSCFVPLGFNALFIYFLFICLSCRIEAQGLCYHSIASFTCKGDTSAIVLLSYLEVYFSM